MIFNILIKKLKKKLILILDFSSVIANICCNFFFKSIFHISNFSKKHDIFHMFS